MNNDFDDLQDHLGQQSHFYDNNSEEQDLLFGQKQFNGEFDGDQPISNREINRANNTTDSQQDLLNIPTPQSFNHRAQYTQIPQSLNSKIQYAQHAQSARTAQPGFVQPQYAQPPRLTNARIQGAQPAQSMRPRVHFAQTTQRSAPYTQDSLTHHNTSHLQHPYFQNAHQHIQRRAQPFHQHSQATRPAFQQLSTRHVPKPSYKPEDFARSADAIVKIAIDQRYNHCAWVNDPRSDIHNPPWIRRRQNHRGSPQNRISKPQQNQASGAQQQNVLRPNPAQPKHASMQPPRPHSTRPARQGAKDARAQKPAQRLAARQEQVRRNQLQTLDIPSQYRRRRSTSAGNIPVIDFNSTQTFHNDMHVLSAGFDPIRAQLPLQTQVYGPEPKSAVSEPPRPQNRSKPKKEYPWLAKSKCDQPDFRF